MLERARGEGRRLLEELWVTCAGRLVAAPAAVFVVLGEGEAGAGLLGEGFTGAGLLGEGFAGAGLLGEGFTGTGLFEAAGTCDVIATETVGLGAVWVATTTLCVAGTGMTVAVEVEASISGCAGSAEQNERKGSNSGSTSVCSVDFVESPFATTQSLQAPSSVSKDEPLAQRAGDLPTLCASRKQLLHWA